MIVMPSSRSDIEGLASRFVTFEGDDPIAFVIDENLHRRQLNPSQRAIAAARIETLRWGQRPDYINKNAATSAEAPAANGKSVMSRFRPATPRKTACLILSRQSDGVAGHPSRVLGAKGA